MESQSPTKALNASLAEDEQHLNLMTNMSIGFSCMLHVFRYLSVRELLQAAQVCRMWDDIAAHPSLWKTVKMKDCMVVDWRGFAETLQRRGTQHLDLQEMWLPANTERMWDEFNNHIGLVTSLTTLDLCCCPSHVVDMIDSRCPQLEVINALDIERGTIELSGVCKLKNLQELRLGSLTAIVVSTLNPLVHLTQLRDLSLTTFKNLGMQNLAVLGSLKALKSLELGECWQMPQDFSSKILLQLKNLEKLRLEKCMGKKCSALSILQGICKLPNLIQLELINFDVEPGFDKALAQCSNIRRLLIIPTYLNKAGATNLLVMSGVIELHNTLRHFLWGITSHLITVTNFLDEECLYGSSSMGSNKSRGEDRIPILKPADGNLLFSLLEETRTLEYASTMASNFPTYGANRPQEADERATTSYSITVGKSKEFLSNSLPKTKVQIFKIPSYAAQQVTFSKNIS